MQNKIDELGSQVAHEAKKFAKNPNRVYLVGGGASLIFDAIKAAYPTLGTGWSCWTTPSPPWRGRSASTPRKRKKCTVKRP